MDAVTGAFSYSGAAIATELARRGKRVRTLTNHPARNPSSLPPALAALEKPARARKRNDRRTGGKTR